MDRNFIGKVRRNKLFPLLSAIKFLLDSIEPQNSFREELLALLNRNVRLLSLHDMGFLDGWNTQPIWMI